MRVSADVCRGLMSVAAWLRSAVDGGLTSGLDQIIPARFLRQFSFVSSAVS